MKFSTTYQGLKLLLKAILLCVACLLFIPEYACAQSEEDILNSIGDELESEADKKKAEEAKKKQYNSIKAKANKAMASKKFKDAVVLFNQMLEIDPESDFAKNQIRLAKQREEEAAQAAIDEKYAAIVAQADKLLASEKWDAAELKYQEALKVKSSESYPKEKIKGITKLKAAKAEEAKLAAKQKQYDAAVAQADKALSGKKWDLAKQKYEEAAAILPEESYPKEKLGELGKLKKEAEEAAKQAAVDAKYDGIIKVADGLFKSKKWDEAKAKYQEASGVKPSESYPKDQISEADRLKKEAADAAAQAEIDAKYDGLIKAADGLFKSKNWDEAKAKYQEASGVKPSESYPKDQISESDRLKKEAADAAAQAETDAKYDGLIKEADGLFKSKSWDEAKAKYQEASVVKPNESYPKDQISEADRLKKEAADAAAQAKTDAKYDGLIKAADGLFKSKNWDEAKAKYQEASVVKPSESYPKDQISEADRLKKEAADATAQAETDAKYDGLIKEADGLFKSKKWDEAKAKYQEASVVKPNESYPKDQISEADRLKKEAADAAAQAETDAKYDGLIKVADNLFKSKNWDEAKAKYQEASVVKPSETYPKDQISEADRLKKEAADAAVQAETDAKYDGLVAQADGLFESEKWDEAIAKYNEALAIKSGESHPAKQIEKANQQKAKANAEQEAQAALDNQYKQLMADGEIALSNEKFEEAIAAFEQAKKLKKDETAPSERIGVAQAAQKAAEEIAKQAAEEAEKLAKANEAYTKVLEEANSAFESKDWEKATAAYQKAAEILPNEQYPKSRIKEVEEARLAEKQAAEQAAALEAQKAAEKQAKFSKLLADGDAQQAKQDWAAALASYTEAAGLMSESKEPSAKIKSLEKAKKKWEEEQADALAEKKKQEELNNAYQAAIDKGDAAFKANEFDQARAAYKEAKGLKPIEEYPLTQLKLVDQKENEIKAAEKAAAEEAKRKAKENAEKFKQLVDNASSNFKNKQYEQAIGQLEEALTIKAGDEKALSLLQEAKLAKKNADDEKRRAEEAAQRAKELEANYQKAIADGDVALAKEKPIKAEEAYQRASSLKPEESYPKDQLKLVEALKKKLKAKLKKEQAALAAKQEKIQKFLKESDLQLEKQNFVKAKQYLEKALKLDPENESIQQKISGLDQKANKQAEYQAKKAKERAEEEAKKQAELEKKQAELRAQIKDEMRKKAREYDPVEIAKRYPEGMTTEEIDQGYRKIQKTIIVKNGVGRAYVLFDYPWGGKFYYLNGKPVQDGAYYHAVKPSF